MAGAANILIRIVDWGAQHQLIIQRPFVFETRPVVMVIDRQPIEVLSPFVQEVVEQRKDLTPIEQKIVERWGERYGYIALAIFRCESGLRADAVNWGSRDVGIAQINWPTWEKKVYDQFGYTLKDMFDEDKNLEVAYWIWERSGSFEPWVAFTTGSFRGCIK